MAKLFKVPPSEFSKTMQFDEYAELHNALARNGAFHLQESDAVIPTRAGTVAQDIRDALISGVPRLITALGPVLIRNIDRIRLPRLRAMLAEIGLERRLWWLIENVLLAIQGELATAPARSWSKRYRRAIVVLEPELELAVAHQRRAATPDLLDPDIRTTKTRKQVEAAASGVSKRWGIITALQPTDFARALRAARVAN